MMKTTKMVGKCKKGILETEGVVEIEQTVEKKVIVESRDGRQRRDSSDRRVGRAEKMVEIDDIEGIKVILETEEMGEKGRGKVEIGEMVGMVETKKSARQKG